MAAILKFQVAVGGLLSSDYQRLLMPISMLVSPNTPQYHLTAPLASKNTFKGGVDCDFTFLILNSVYFAVGA